MNRNQWNTLAWSCMLIGMMFICLDLSKGGISVGCDYLDNSMYESYIDGGITEEIYREFLLDSRKLEYKSDITCAVLGEIFEPFIYMFYALFVVFMICGFLEGKK